MQHLTTIDEEPPASGRSISHFNDNQGLLNWVFLAALLCMFALRASDSTVDPDLFHEMALAREAWSRGWVPWNDSFAYTPTVSPCVHHEWGAGVIAFATSSWLGGAGIIIVKFGLVLALSWVCWCGARLRNATFPVFGLLAIIAILIADDGFSTIRAQMYSYLFTGLLFCLLEHDRRGHRYWLLGWLVIHVLWLNLHAGFLVGMGLFAVHLLERLVRREPSRHLLVGLIIMVALIAVNPYGWHYYAYLWRAVPMDRALIREWAPLWEAARPHEIGAFFVGLFLIAYAVCVHGWRKLDGLGVLLVTAIYAVKHTRMLPFFAIAWLCYVPGYMQTTGLGETISKSWRDRCTTWLAIWSFSTLALLLALFSGQPWKIRVPGVSTKSSRTAFAVGPTDYLDARRFHGNLMVPYDHGAYVSWKLHPRVKVAIDARYEVAFPSGALEDNYRLYLGRRGWQHVLKQHPPDAILVPRWSPLSALLVQGSQENEGDWHLKYQDDTFLLFASNSLIEWPVVDRRGEHIQGSFP